jgi:hypothetical protein
LTGKIRRGQPQPEVSRLPQTANYGPPVPDDQLYKVVDAIDEVAKETGKSVPQNCSKLSKLASAAADGLNAHHWGSQ